MAGRIVGLDPRRENSYLGSIRVNRHCCRLSWVRSASSAFGRKLPCWPVGGTRSISGISSMLSLRLAAVGVMPGGTPWPSQIRWCLEPAGRRSTGEGADGPAGVVSRT